MPGRKRIPEETKATVRALKSSTYLMLDEIALRCRISKTSVQRIASAKEPLAVLWKEEKTHSRTRGINS